jgi:N-acetylneuraminic acid mutarotase
MLAPFGNHPVPRSGAASVVHNNQLLLYGGYGGLGRLEDLWSFDFESKLWTQIEYEGNGPGPRENNGVVVMDNCLYVFGGYNGYQWLNDLHQFDLAKRRWRLIEPRGTPPSSRFGYVSAAFHDPISGRKELVLFAGYDGSTWLNDMNVYSFVTGEWSVRRQQGEIPSIRSCPSWARYEDKVFVFGGYDGVQRMNDFWELDLKSSTWTPVRQRGTPPTARYFHSSVVFKNQLLVYGGYSGSNRLGDLHSFNLETSMWSRVETDGEIPAGRSSLVMQVYGNCLWLLGGYNGREVLNDLYQLPLEVAVTPPPTLLDDLLRLVNNKDLGDVVFSVGGEEVYAVSSLLAIRSEHFRALLFGGMKEGNTKINREPIVVQDIDHHIFLLMMEFLHTDNLRNTNLELDDAVALLIAGERFLLDRLKSLCVEFIRNRIACNNVVHILLTSYRHNALVLKELCLDFIVSQFESVKHTADFKELQREPELLMHLVLRIK